MLPIRMFAASIVACLKKDMGREFGKLTVESVFEDFIEFPALVKAKGDRIVVTFYGNYKEKHKAAVEELMRGFDETGRMYRYHGWEIEELRSGLSEDVT